MLEEYRQYKKEEQFFYDLLIEGHSKAGTVESDFKMQSAHELIFLDHDKDKNMWRFNLKELSYSLDKYDNPIIVQIVEMSNKISEMYKELDFWVNEYGVIQKINNREQIQERWEKIREYLTYKYPLNSYEIIMAKEHEMANEKAEIQNIRFINFIHFYFFQFGIFDNERNFKARDMDRFGSGTEIIIDCKETRKDNDGKINRHFDCKMVENPDTIRALQKSVKDDFGEVIYKTRSDYHSDGLIVEEANFGFTEKIGDTYSLYSNLHMKLRD